MGIENELTSLIRNYFQILLCLNVFLIFYWQKLISLKPSGLIAGIFFRLIDMNIPEISANDIA